MFLRLNPSSGVPIYLQLMEQVKHAVETGSLAPGDQLPGIRSVAERLVTNPNTVAKAYRELQHDGVIEIRHGSGAYISETHPLTQRTPSLKTAQQLVRNLIEKLSALKLTEDEIRRLLEGELSKLSGEAVKGVET